MCFSRAEKEGGVQRSKSSIDIKKSESNRPTKKVEEKGRFSSPHIYDQTPFVDEEEELIGNRLNADGGNEWLKLSICGTPH